MDSAEKLLRNWRQSKPRDGVRCEDALRVISFLGMDVEQNNQGHYQASHEALKGSAAFPYGTFTMNCHASGIQGKAHQRAVQDLLKAAKIIQDKQQEEQHDHENK